MTRYYPVGDSVKSGSIVVLPVVATIVIAALAGRLSGSSCVSTHRVWSSAVVSVIAMMALSVLGVTVVVTSGKKGLSMLCVQVLPLKGPVYSGA